MQAQIQWRVPRKQQLILDAASTSSPIPFLSSLLCGKLRPNAGSYSKDDGAIMGIKNPLKGVVV